MAWWWGCGVVLRLRGCCVVVVGLWRGGGRVGAGAVAWGGGRGARLRRAAEAGPGQGRRGGVRAGCGQLAGRALQVSWCRGAGQRAARSRTGVLGRSPAVAAAHLWCIMYAAPTTMSILCGVKLTMDMFEYLAARCCFEL